MNIRKSLTGLAIVGTLAVGVVGVADAATPSTTTDPSTTSHTLDCPTAEARLAKLHTRVDTVNASIAKAEARISELRSQGHDQRADKLATRLANVKDRLAKAETRLSKVTSKVEARCDATTSTTPSA